MVVGPFAENVGFIIQARMGSSRLPGKVLMSMPFGARHTLLGRICDSLLTLGGKLIVATSKLDENDAIDYYCRAKGIECYRGAENDVFSRFHAIQEKYKFSNVFRFTADNPFIDQKKLVQFYNRFLKADLDYAFSNGMPLGMNFEVMRGETILSLAKTNLSDAEREHVTLGVRNNNKFRKEEIRIAESTDYRLTVDNAADYLLSSTLFQILGDSQPSLQNIESAIKKYSWLSSVNEGFLQKCSTDIEAEQKRIVASFVSNLGYNRVSDALLSKIPNE
jgi:spore coat polysaccharide biosynthesis protein SpsF